MSANGTGAEPERIDGAAVLHIRLRRVFLELRFEILELVVFALVAAMRAAGRHGAAFLDTARAAARPSAVLVARLVGVEFPKSRRQVEAEALVQRAGIETVCDQPVGESEPERLFLRRCIPEGNEIAGRPVSLLQRRS
ncbi:hypothetical protein Msil_3012 [Methylocella silvestris BL2]|uniref:Uncharacterized protein n=1 Tax=Methylocella silvestris (strain DSM 15510 / CIP 108128 / LMG 27833 / NCIMB 13906 / BL2) TaxID=395965 RepID=B8EKP5_METSB|nr:hypothetical protein Msil_3012 [Methylocella silvestris BL2]